MNYWNYLVAVNSNGDEIYTEYGGFKRVGNSWSSKSDFGRYCKLPKGTIKKIIGKELTWNDEPVCIEEISNEQN